MPRFSFLASVAILAVLEACSPPPTTAGTPSIDRRCSSAILMLGHPGDRRVEVDQDGHGHSVELWCTNGIFTSQWDLRIPRGGRSDLPQTAVAAPPAASHRGLTIGGCFFDNGTNSGPDIDRDPGGAFTKVAWTNRSAFGEPRTYRFSYDFHTRLVTITLTTPCGAPVSKVVAPQESYAKMDALLPDPPSTACGWGLAQPGTAGR